MVTFLDRAKHQCCAPVSGDPGPLMEVCGDPVKPGTAYCPVHYRQFYVPLGLGVVREIKQTAIRSNRQQRMTVLSKD